MTELINFLKKWCFYALGASIILMLVFIKGCSYGKSHKICAEIVTHTVILRDTITHRIIDKVPYYIQGKTQIVYKTDTIFKNIDTIAVVRDYFSTHITDNVFQDSLLQVFLTTYISQNELKHSIFKYKILRPQEITTVTQDNSTNYSKYLYAGGSVPVNDLKYASVSLFYASQRALIGCGYVPALKGLQVTGAIKLFSFKK